MWVADFGYQNPRFSLNFLRKLSKTQLHILGNLGQRLCCDILAPLEQTSVRIGPTQAARSHICAISTQLLGFRKAARSFFHISIENITT